MNVKSNRKPIVPADKFAIFNGERISGYVDGPTIEDARRAVRRRYKNVSGLYLQKFSPVRSSELFPV